MKHETSHLCCGARQESAQHGHGSDGRFAPAAHVPVSASSERRGPSISKDDKETTTCTWKAET